MTRTLRRIGGLSAAGLVPSPAFAHSFGSAYVLPVPFWMYLFGSVAVLVVTFVILGLFVTSPSQETGDGSGKIAAGGTVFDVPRELLVVLRIGAVVCLALTILTGFIGSEDPGENLGMTLFWVVFLLGLAYFTLFAGDLYALCNPWKLAVDALERIGLPLSTGRITYSDRIGYWPAFLAYLAVVWIELFSGQVPSHLSFALVIYSLITFCGCALFGKDVWFRKADVFSVYFRTIAILAPIDLHHDGARWRARLRRPFSGVLEARTRHLSFVLFVLFFLSSTAYDALHDTELWNGLYWKNLLALLQSAGQYDLGKAQEALYDGFLIYRQIGLVVFPFVYLGVYWLALAGMKGLSKDAVTIRELELGFCCSLVPLAFFYNAAHYGAFFVDQLGRMPYLLSDPFSRGWNLLGTGPVYSEENLNMGLIWHSQVFSILFGHIVSVILGHLVAARIFTHRSTMVISQLPLLFLMIFYTMFGLFILTLPIGAV